MFLVGVAFGALVDATVIGWRARAPRRGERPDRTLRAQPEPELSDVSFAARRYSALMR
ncbi:hypothetical protein QF030_004524 [Streptomyces rishiriensis]|uniref:Uncharacterized protein n=1 Tax=Streptomyces rishiriensis TaxID=68264 RepID=A0ABU0NT86_STRRH|nr:hypothetical protein [Streptomyces rishiriensis]